MNDSNSHLNSTQERNALGGIVNLDQLSQPHLIPNSDFTQFSAGIPNSLPIFPTTVFQTMPQTIPNIPGTLPSTMSGVPIISSSVMPGIPIVPPIPINNPGAILTTSASSSSLPVYNPGVLASSGSTMPHFVQAAPILKSIDVYSDDPSLIYKPVEDMMGGQVSTTAFIGSIVEGISDDLIQRILEVCIFNLILILDLWKGY